MMSPALKEAASRGGEYAAWFDPQSVVFESVLRHRPKDECPVRDRKECQLIAYVTVVAQRQRLDSVPALARPIVIPLIKKAEFAQDIAGQFAFRWSINNDIDRNTDQYPFQRIVGMPR
jgi:hypothetical protein